MSKISVIIPIYNSEKYIAKCARYLFKQTLNDIEYIFIDDCSPDNSIDVLHSVIGEYHQYLEKEKKIVRIERMSMNSRQAAVRKYGMQLATGDYIIHCDSDDWVDTDLYEKLYNKAIETKAEIIMCPIVDEYNGRQLVRDWNNYGNDCQKVLENWFHDTVAMFTVNKLVKRNVLTDNNILPFDDINMWEDNGIMLRTFYYAKGLAQINESYYHYFRENENATTHSYGRCAVNQMINCAALLDSFFKEQADYLKYKKTADSVKFFARINLVTDSYKELKEYYSTFPETDYIIPQINKNAFSSKGYFRFILVKHHLAWLFVLMYKIEKIISKIFTFRKI